MKKCSLHFIVLYIQRSFFYLVIVTIIFFSNHHLFASRPALDLTEWYSLSKKFSCVLSASVKQTVITPIAKQQHKPLTKFVWGPIFKPSLILSLTLKYKGHETILVKWDKRFYRMLWEQEFVLITTQNKIRFSSKKAFLTSNIGRYPASEEINLAPYTVLKSKLNLWGYVGVGLRKGNATFQLYVANKGKNMIPVCNPVKVIIN